MTDETNSQVTEAPVAAESNPAVAESVKADIASTSLDFNSILSSLPEDLRSDPSLSTIKDTSTLVKNYINAQKMIGNSVRIPRQDDPQELKDSFFAKLKDVPGIMKIPTNEAEQQALFSALGRPISADGYALNAPEGAEFDPNIINEFKGVAHKLGLSNNQAAALVNFQLQQEGKARAANEAEVAATTALLSKEWGSEYTNRINAVKELISTYSNKFPDQAAALVDNRVMNNPVVLMMAAELAKTYKEQGLIKESNTLQWGLTPEEAREKILEVKNNPELSKAYFDDRHPNHKAIVDKMQQYYNASHS